MYKLHFGPLLRQYFIVITVNLSVLVTGLGLAWPSPVFVKLRNSTETILPSPMTEEQGSWIVSIGFLTGLSQHLVAAYLVDRIGRKSCIIISCLPKILVGFLYIFASEVWMLLLGRAILGISDIYAFNTVPMYASEIASKEIRGALGTILQILCSIGVVLMMCIGPFVSYLHLNIIYTCFALIVTVPMLFLPDSPYFLYSRGKNQEALRVLTYLRGSESIASDELKEYSLCDKQTVAKRELFKNRTFLKSLFIVLVLSGGTQLVGFNSISFYLQTILESTHTSVQPELASVITGIIQLVSSLCTTLVTDKFGRKPILTTTLAAMVFGLMGLGIFFKLKETIAISGLLNFLPIASVILVVIGYSAGLGSLVWVLSAELFEDSSRGIGIGISSLFSSICVFLTTKYFAQLTSVIGSAETYWLFSFNSFLLCAFVLFYVPETKGKSFAEIQSVLRGKGKSETANFCRS